MDDATALARASVLSHYSDDHNTPRCKCCHATEPDALNAIPERVDSAGQQVTRPNDAPTTDRQWQRLNQMGFPDTYIVICSNCVALHRLGPCPLAAS